MRGIILRALPVCVAVFATGCLSMFGTTNTPVGARTPTHAYWQGAGAALGQKPIGGEMKDLVFLVRSQTDALRAMSPEGVDPALVAAVDDLIKCEEEVLRRADMCGNDPNVLKTSEPMARAFAEANRAAAESKKRLKALRGGLIERHGSGFTPIGG